MARMIVVQWLDSKYEGKQQAVPTCCVVSVGPEDDLEVGQLVHVKFG